MEAYVVDGRCHEDLKKEKKIKNRKKARAKHLQVIEPQVIECCVERR